LVSRPLFDLLNSGENFMPRTLGSALVALGVAVLATSVADAQMRRSPFGTSRVSLATLEPVQEELKLTADQKKLADELHDDLTEDRREVFQGGGGDFEAMRKEIEELDAAATGKLTEKLDDSQKGRLTGIYVQANGPNALADLAVMEALELTDEQKGKLESARQDNRDDFFDAFQDFQGMNDEERREAMTKLRDDADARLLAVLTEEQRAEFEELEGEEVDYDLNELRGGFPGGGGGARRGADDSDRPQRPE
jgi:Spy/CpxP family protein refolding chaperone